MGPSAAIRGNALFIEPMAVGPRAQEWSNLDTVYLRLPKDLDQGIETPPGRLAFLLLAAIRGDNKSTSTLEQHI